MISDTIYNQDFRQYWTTTRPNVLDMLSIVLEIVGISFSTSDLTLSHSKGIELVTTEINVQIALMFIEILMIRIFVYDFERFLLDSAKRENLLGFNTF